MAKRGLFVESGPGLPVAPMVDVVLLLLIFFMLITRFLPPTLNITLPESATALTDDRPSIALAISRAGELSVDGETFSWAALPRLLDGREPHTLVRVAADRETDYLYVIRALDAAAEAGLVNIALETVPKD